MPTFLYKKSDDVEIKKIPLEQLLKELGLGKTWVDEAFAGNSPKKKLKKENHDFVIVKNPGGMGHTLITNRDIKKGEVICKYPGQIYLEPDQLAPSRSPHCLALAGSLYKIDGGQFMGYGSLLPALPDKATLKKHEIMLADKRLNPMQEIATANIEFEPDYRNKPPQMLGRAIEDIPSGATLGFHYFHTDYFTYSAYIKYNRSPLFLNRLGGELFDKKYTVGRPLVMFPKKEDFLKSIEPYLSQSIVPFLEANGAAISIPWNDPRSGESMRCELPAKSHSGKIDPQDIFIYMCPIARADVQGRHEKKYLDQAKNVLSLLSNSKKSWLFQKNTDLFVLEITTEENKEAITAFVRARLAMLGAEVSYKRSKDGRHFLSIPAIVCTEQKLDKLLSLGQAGLLGTTPIANTPAEEKENTKGEVNSRPAATPLPMGEQNIEALERILSRMALNQEGGREVSVDAKNSAPNREIVALTRSLQGLFDTMREAEEVAAAVRAFSGPAMD